MTASNSAPSDRRLRTVLLIDDDPADNYLHRVVLEDSGAVERILEFAYAEEALDHLRAGDDTVDVIFLDVNLPRMDGFEFLDAYHALGDARAGESVVLLSSALTPEDQKRAAAHPRVMECLAKPLTRESLETVLARRTERQPPD